MNELMLMNRIKSPGTAFICALFGVHYIYLQKWGLLVAYYLTFAGFGLWWLIDVVSISGRVTNENNQIMLQAQLLKNNNQGQQVVNVQVQNVQPGQNVQPPTINNGEVTNEH